MALTFPTTSLKKPSGVTALPSGFKRPAFGTLYGFDAQGGGGGAAPAFSNDWSISLDGTNDYLNPADTFSTLWGGTFAISVWYRTPSSFTSVDGMIVGNYYATTKGNIEFRITGTSSSEAKVGLWFSPAIVSGGDYNAYGKETADDALTTNTWYHLCWATDRPASGTTSSKFYINGVEATLSAGAYGGIDPIHNAATFATSSYSIVGSRNGASSGVGSTTHALPGLLDEMAFFNSSLSASNVTAIYNSGTPVDLGTGGLNLSPVGWWRMGDNDSGTGTTITDQGSGGNDGTFGGGPTFSPAVPPGYSTKALDFDGADDYVDCGGASTFSFTDGAGNDEPFSISAWVKLDSVNRARVVGKDDDTQETREYLFGTDGDNKFTMFLGTSTDNLYIRLGSASSTGTWYHWVATYDGSNSASGITLYVDGATPVTEDMSQGTYVGMPAGGGPLLIGMLGVNDSVLDGLADEVAIFDSELSASDVTAIYNSGVPADLTSLSPVGWWRMGEDATWDGTNWTIPDASTNSNAGTTANMAEASRVTDTP